MKTTRETMIEELVFRKYRNLIMSTSTFAFTRQEYDERAVHKEIFIDQFKVLTDLELMALLLAKV